MFSKSLRRRLTNTVPAFGEEQRADSRPRPTLPVGPEHDLILHCHGHLLMAPFSPSRQPGVSHRCSCISLF